jgi:hypothetical protein
VVFGAVILVHLDVPIMLGEGQVGTIDHDDFEYFQVPEAGRYPVGGQVLDFIKAADAVRKNCDQPFQPRVHLVGRWWQGAANGLPSDPLIPLNNFLRLMLVRGKSTIASLFPSCIPGLGLRSVVEDRGWPCTTHWLLRYTCHPLSLWQSMSRCPSKQGSPTSMFLPILRAPPRRLSGVELSMAPPRDTTYCRLRCLVRSLLPNISGPGRCLPS